MILACVVLLGIFTLFPLITVFQSMWDNIYTDLHVREGKGVLEIAREHYGQMGRLQALIVYPMDTAIWIVRNPVFYQVVKLGFLLAGVGLTGMLLRRITGSQTFSLLFAGLFFISVQNHINFDLLNGFSISIHTGAITFAISAIAIARWVVRRRTWLLGLASVSFFVAMLTYEMFVPFVFVLPFLGLLEFRRHWGYWENFKCHLLPPLLWLSGAVVAFLALYVIARGGGSERYAGTEIAPFSLPNIFALYWDYTMAGFPLYHLFHLGLPINRELFDSHFMGHRPLSTPLDLFRVTEVNWIVKALLAGGLAWLALPRMPIIDRRQKAVLFSIGIALVALPNLFMAVSAGHQSFHAEDGFVSHNTTYFCHLGFVILLAAGFLTLGGGIRKRSEFSIRSTSLAVAIIFAVVSFLTDFWNAPVHRMEQQFSKKWRAIDRVLASPEFDALPEDALVFAPSLYRSRTYWERDLYKHHEYWSRVAVATGHSGIRLLRGEKDLVNALEKTPDAHVAYMKFAEDPHVNRQFVLLADQVDFSFFPGASEIDTASASLFHFSDARNLEILGNWSQGEGGSWGQAKEWEVLPRGANTFQLRVGSDVDVEGRTVVALDPESGRFDPRSLTVSYFLYENEEEEDLGASPEALSAPYWGKDWYEEGADGKRWNWNEKGDEIRIFHEGSQPKKILLSISLYGCQPTEKPFAISWGERRVEKILSAPEDVLSIDEEIWELKPGINFLRLFPASFSQEVDGRWINFGVEGFRLDPVQ